MKSTNSSANDKMGGSEGLLYIFRRNIRDRSAIKNHFGFCNDSHKLVLSEFGPTNRLLEATLQ